MGRKHEPTFRLVLTDSKNSTKSGRFQEVLGAYDPRRAIDTFNTDRIKALVAQGVALTGSVNNLLLKHGIIRGKKTHVGSNFVPKVVEPVEEAPAPEVAETPAESAPEPVVEESAPAEETPAVEEAAPEASPEATETQNS